MKAQEKDHPGQMKEQIKTLSESARTLVSRGELSDAEKIYSRIISIAPYHASSLSFMAAQAQARGDIDGAVSLLDKAIKGNPKNAPLLQNRGLAYRQLGRLDAALTDLDLAISFQPDLYSAQIYKAFVLRDSGDMNGAIRLVAKVMREAPDLRSWVAGSLSPEQLPALVVEALNILRAAQLALIDAEMQPVIDRFGKASLQRVFEAVANYAGLREKNPAAPNPTIRSLTIEGLNTGTGFKAPLDVWPAGDRADVRAISAEVATLVARRTDIRPNRAGHAATDADPTSLSRYLLNLTPAQLAESPALVALKREALGEHGPAAAGGMTVVVAQSGKHVLQQATGTNWRLTAYALLTGPDVATLEVAGHSAKLSSGRCVLASELAKHSFEAGGGQVSILLCMQVWHPDLTDAEIEGLTAVMSAFERFRAKYT